MSDAGLWEQISSILGVIRPLCRLFPEFRGINGERTDMLIKRLVDTAVPVIERDRALIAELRAELEEARRVLALWRHRRPQADRIDALLERTKP